MFERVKIGLPRTNNGIEGWHWMFEDPVGYAHPSKYKLIDSIQLENSHSGNMETKIDGG